MHRLLQTLILAIFLVLMHAVWQPANAATSFCDGLDCGQCEVDLNAALATNFIATSAFVCGHDGGGNLMVAFMDWLNGPTRIFADYDGFNSSCSVFVDRSLVGTEISIEVPEMARPSINAWKKVLREVCRNY